ncbi:hypothetical protein K7432_001967 [Basidiobolus ranarum]|uniref:Uncharacterized protein n=1 Tax=Basidiobolus ranarum TaxID=34480 RepID=A0ABR2X2H9_9FUNG
MFPSSSPAHTSALVPAPTLRNNSSTTSFTTHLRKLAHKATFKNLRAERRAREQEELERRGTNELLLALKKLKSVYDFDDMIENGFLVDVKTGYREPTVRFSLTPILARDYTDS